MWNYFGILNVKLFWDIKYEIILHILKIAGSNWNNAFVCIRSEVWFMYCGDEWMTDCYTNCFASLKEFVGLLKPASLLLFWTTISLRLEVCKYANSLTIKKVTYMSKFFFRLMIKNLMSSCSIRIYTTVCAILFGCFHDENINNVLFLCFNANAVQLHFH